MIKNILKWYKSLDKWDKFDVDMIIIGLVLGSIIFTFLALVFSHN